MVRLRIGRQTLHGAQPSRVGQRPHGGGRIQPVAYFQAAGMCHKLIDERLVHAFLHQKTGRRDTHLARIAVLGGDHGLGSQGHVRIVKHNHWCMAPQLHGHALHVQTRHGGQLLAHLGRAGE